MTSLTPPSQTKVAVAYFSNVTNNTETFMRRLAWDGVMYRIPVQGVGAPLTEPYVLAVPSYGSSATNHVPPQVKKWLVDEQTRNACVGVLGFGNLNFGHEFCWAGWSVATKLGVPYLHSIDLAGNTDDLEYVEDLLRRPELFQEMATGVVPPHHTPMLAEKLRVLTQK